MGVVLDLGMVRFALGDLVIEVDHAFLQTTQQIWDQRLGSVEEIFLDVTTTASPQEARYIWTPTGQTAVLTSSGTWSLTNPVSPLSFQVLLPGERPLANYWACLEMSMDTQFGGSLCLRRAVDELTVMTLGENGMGPGFFPLPGVDSTVTEDGLAAGIPLLTQVITQSGGGSPAGATLRLSSSVDGEMIQELNFPALRGETIYHLGQPDEYRTSW